MQALDCFTLIQVRVPAGVSSQSGPESLFQRRMGALPYFSFARAASSFLRSRMNLFLSFSGMASTVLVRFGSFS